MQCSTPTATRRGPAARLFASHLRYYELFDNFGTGSSLPSRADNFGAGGASVSDDAGSGAGQMGLAADVGTGGIIDRQFGYGQDRGQVSGSA